MIRNTQESFDAKAKGEKFQKDLVALIQEVLPELVRENEDGKLSLRDKGIVPILVEAIKELKAEIEELKKSK